jgi:hypothetical protein
MTQSTPGIAPFSAEVDLWLDCEHGRVPLAQVSDDFVIASNPTTLPVCEAEVVVSVDGHLHSRRVLLVNGMSQDNRRAAVQPLEPAPF